MFAVFVWFRTNRRGWRRICVLRWPCESRRKMELSSEPNSLFRRCCWKSGTFQKWSITLGISQKALNSATFFHQEAWMAWVGSRDARTSAFQWAEMSAEPLTDQECSLTWPAPVPLGWTCNTDVRSDSLLRYLHSYLLEHLTHRLNDSLGNSSWSLTAILWPLCHIKLIKSQAFIRQ